MRSDQVIQSFVQSCLDNLWRWRLPSCPYGETVFSYSQLISVYASWFLFSHHTPLARAWIHLLANLGKAAVRSPLTLMFSRLNKSSFLSLSSQEKCGSSPLTIQLSLC